MRRVQKDLLVDQSRSLASTLLAMAGVYPTISVFVSAMQDLFCATADATLVFLSAYNESLYELDSDVL